MRRPPGAIALMAMALGVSLTLVGLDAVGLSRGLHEAERALVERLDFSRLLLQGMLSLLLFAGALHVDLGALKRLHAQVSLLAFAGTAASTVLVGAGVWALLQGVGLGVPLLPCMLFGALISPTDPIAVLGMLKTVRAPRELAVVIAGESLFNDGVGIVLFLSLLALLDTQAHASAGGALALLVRSTGGGLAYGWLLGRLLRALLARTAHRAVEILLSLAAVTGGYALADELGVSGPLAMVMAGLVVGELAHRRLARFWEIVDEVLNAVLFVLVGLQVAVVRPPGPWGAASLALAGAVLVVLAARWLTVGLPVQACASWFRLPRGAGVLLTWGGLRGAISIALALSLPATAHRDTFIALTYGVVVFSILVQGLTFRPLVRRLLQPS